MRPDALKKPFFSILLLLLPLAVFAQSNRTQTVALVPFWGPVEQFITEFGEELFKGVSDMQGYRPVVIDMTNLPDDVPEGGFPPYICPSPSLIKTNPIALTGELTQDPDDEEFWHMRLYLWEMSETRLVFSDELTAYDRDEVAAGLPGMLEWLFSWLNKKGGGSGTGGEGDTTNMSGQGRNVFITTSMPLQWMYVGVRAGGALRMQERPTEYETEHYYKGNFYDTINAAVLYSIAFFPESVPFFSRFGLQVEGVFNYDMDITNNKQKIPAMTISPTALLKCHIYRQGNMLYSIFAGAYTTFPISDTIKTFAKYQPFPVGLTAGLCFAGKIDPIPGLFFIDLRYSRDQFKSNTIVSADRDREFRRSAVTISVGYEFGIITKK